MKIYQGLCAFLAVTLLIACETDDVAGPAPYFGPNILLSADNNSFSENNGVATVTATLSETSEQDISIQFAFGGEATGNGVDYITSAETLTIPANSLSASLTISAVQDTIEEGNESIVLSIIGINGNNVAEAASLTLTIEDDDVPLQLQIIVNEILYDPSNSGLDGDANGDGSYAQSEDEFIEFINLSSQPADLSGFMIYDTEALTANTPRHTIPAGTVIPPGKALVVFGGGTPTGTFGGALVQTSTTGNMNLNNAGDIMTLTDTAGRVVVTFDIEPLSNNPNESYTRNPDITGDFEQHGENMPLLFSPGTKIDGSPF